MKSHMRRFQRCLLSVLIFNLLLGVGISPVFAQSDNLEYSSDVSREIIKQDVDGIQERKEEQSSIEVKRIDQNDEKTLGGETEVIREYSLNEVDPDPTPFNLQPLPPQKQQLPDVDINSGALVYSYPIVTPPGRRGMEPHVSLTYNNQNTDEGSVIGFGWTLNLPTIERKNLSGLNKLYLSHDFSSSLDGDLKEISGSGDEILFGAKIDLGSFSAYTFHDEEEGGWWTVNTKEGMIYTFGLTSASQLHHPEDSTKVFKWYLTKLEDSLGNFITYEYSKINNQVYPSHITYTNFEEEEGIFNIDFILEDRNDVSQTAKPGFLVATLKRIQKIEVKVEEILVGRYDFSYEQGLVNNRSQLSGIQYTGYSDSAQATAQPPTLFEYNSIAQTNLLSMITFPAGGNSSVTYKLSSQYIDNNGQLLNPRLPFGVQTVQEIEYNDGNSNNWSHTFEYSGGWFYYDGPFDRRFVGFEKTVKKNNEGIKTISYYHQGNGDNSGFNESDDEMAKAGKLYKTELINAEDEVMTKTIKTWATSDIGSGRTFTTLEQILELTYDGDESHKDKALTYTYSTTTGNATSMTNWGEVTGSENGTYTDIGADKLVTTYSYASGNGITGLLSKELTVDQTAAKVKEILSYYDNQTWGNVTVGNETKKEQWKIDSTYVNSQKVYDAYGLVTSEIDPRSNITSYTYDIYNLYPTNVTNPLDHEKTYTYDYSSGQVKDTTDVNGHTSTTTYDGLDRPLEEKIPNATSSGQITKTTYEYTDTANAVKTKVSQYLDGSNIVDTYTYFDGLNRKLQERVETGVTNQFSVRDFIYNNLGLLAGESLPYFSTGVTKTSPTTNTDLYTTYTYDAAQRIINTATVVGDTTAEYSDWKVATTDAKGNVKDIYKDAYDNIIQVDEHNDNSIYTTTYDYNGLQRLKKITDALGNIRNFTYDGLGNVISSEDLHASTDTTFGTWNYAYDSANNLISRIDPNSQTVTFTYDGINRVLTENYTGASGTEVTYAYDTCTEGVGKLCEASNAASTKEYTYDNQGNIITEEATLGSNNFTTSYTYDRQGNRLLITNPDNSQVQYLYDNGGLVNQIQHKEDNALSFADIISSIEYNPMGSPETIYYGNGSVSINTYDDSELYRLRSKTTEADAVTIQDLTYAYDPVGNIEQIVDASDTDTAKTTDYTYDDLYRLVLAEITNPAYSNVDNPKQELTSQGFEYDAIGNIIYHPEHGTYNYEGNQESNYGNPHAVTSTDEGRLYLYDNNGNVVSDDYSTYAWDYNNRLIEVENEAGSFLYSYDTTGQRMKAETPNDTLYYPTAFYTATDSEPEKHIFFNDTAVATVRGSNSSAETFTIHTDHLSGSNVITNENAEISQVLDYYAFGNLRLNDQLGDYDEKRKFTGLEYDMASGLNYAGSRYYDAVLSRFLSQDSAFLMVGDLQKLELITNIKFEQYISNPQHLNSYSYAFNNPLVYSDEDGKFAVRTFGVGLLQGGKAALNVLSTSAQAALAGGAFAIGQAPAAGILTVSAFGNLDSAFVDTANATANIVGSLSDKEPAKIMNQGPYRDMVSQVVGDTSVFDRVVVAGNVLSFTASDIPTYLSKAGPVYQIYKNARSAGVGDASFRYLAPKVGEITYKTLDVVSQVITSGRGVPDFLEEKLGLIKKQKK